MPLTQVRVTTTGSAGSATGTATTPPLYGILGFVKRDYNASAPATTDYTLTEAGGAQRTLQSISNTATDAVDYPAVQQTANGVAIAGAYTPYILTGTPLTVTLAQCDALTDAIVVTIQTLE